MSSGRPSICSACKAKVIWAKFSDGVVRPIEHCTDGEGTVALQDQLPGVGGRLEARFVSVRTSLRLHLETCPKASVYRNRWRTELRCSGCQARMASLVGGRSVCSTCQARERERLAELAGELVDHFGLEDARARISRTLAREPRGKR